MAVRAGFRIPSGVSAQIQGDLAAAAAGQKSQSVNNINLANEEERQKDCWTCPECAKQGLQKAGPRVEC